MLCFRYKRLLIPYIECGLGDPARERLEAHLAGCESCRVELEALRSVSGALRQAENPAAEPASDLWARVNVRIQTQPTARARTPWLRAPQIASAAAALLVVGIGIGMVLTNPPAVHRQSVPAPPPPVVVSDGRALPDSPKAPSYAAKPGKPRLLRKLPGTRPRLTLMAKADLPSPGAHSASAESRRYGVWYRESDGRPSVRSEDSSPASAPSVERMPARAFDTVEGVEAKGTTVAEHSAGYKYNFDSTTAGDGVGARGAVVGNDFGAKDEMAGGVAKLAASSPAPSAGRLELRAGTAVASASDVSVDRTVMDALGAPAKPGEAKAAAVPAAASAESLSFYSDSDGDLASKIDCNRGDGSVVDALNKADGVRMVAVFTYP